MSYILKSGVVHDDLEISILSDSLDEDNEWECIPYAEDDYEEVEKSNLRLTMREVTDQ
jgi:hypothetical protein